jgi:hypothetical protein
MNKDELLQKIRAAHQELLAVLESVPAERRDEAGLAGGWSVKDSLVHITFWQGQMVMTLFQLRAGTTLSAMHFTNRTVDEINADWLLKGKSRAWEYAWNDFIGLGKQMERRINEFNDAELNNPRLNPKLEGKPLWEWIADDTYGHEDEHREAILAWLRRG